MFIKVNGDSFLYQINRNEVMCCEAIQSIVSSKCQAQEKKYSY